MENINSWKDIQWSSVEHRIFLLQVRIYKASKSKNWEKVHKLQTLIFRSNSAKFLAVKKVTQENQGKNTSGIDNVAKLSPKERLILAKRLKIDGKTDFILRKYIPKTDGTKRPLGIPTIQDRAKQALVHLALSPQWESQFEPNSYGFRPGRSVYDAIEAVRLAIFKKPKWVLDADIEKGFDQIDHEYLIKKCNVNSLMTIQIRAWLKAGIFEDKQMYFPDKATPPFGRATFDRRSKAKEAKQAKEARQARQGGIISPLLANIALHGIEFELENASKLPGHKANNIQALSFIRYADDFVVMHADREILEKAKETVINFLKPIGLKLSEKKTKIIHTHVPGSGFTFLGFDVIQQPIRGSIRYKRTGKNPTQKYITLITPSKESTRLHKRKIRDIVEYRGLSQSRLIMKLNPIIRAWALSKKTQTSSKVFQALDAYVYERLWHWCTQRHGKLSGTRIKQKYFHRVKNRNWVFSVYDSSGKICLELQRHGAIATSRHIKVKGDRSPYDGDVIYWSNRMGKHPTLPPMKARLVRDQKGICPKCGLAFMPYDILERDHIIPKFLGGKNLRSNVQVLHQHCHREKTSKELTGRRKVCFKNHRLLGAV
jgi:RNA-directed DNA polymerase